MPRKRTLSNDLLKDIKPKNKIWLEKYRSESDSKKKYYYTNVQEFLEFCAFSNEKEVKDIDITDVNQYIAALKKYTDSPATINGRLSAISNFRNFLCSKYKNTFGEKFLSNLPSHESTDENPTDIKALSLKQLSYARKYNRRSVKDEYIFELFFQLGIDKKKLIACAFPQERNPQIREIIKNVSKGEVTDGTINSYFTRITNYLKKQGVYEKDRRNINSYDLTESHGAYFFQCPNCKKTFENTTKYWVLAKIKFENSVFQDEYRIVCVQCKGELDEH